MRVSRGLTFSDKFDEYEMRMYQSKDGTFFIAAVPVTSGRQHRDSDLEVNPAKTTRSEMVYEHAFSTPSMSYSTPYSLIKASSTRNGSVVDDIADCLLTINNCWYHFTIHFNTLTHAASANRGDTN